MRRRKKAIFAIHGGGNIGLGLMADIISHSKKPYQILATSSNQLTNKIINTTGKFCLQHYTPEGINASSISNINMINSTYDQNIINLYNQADIGAICLTEEGVKQAAPLIAQGLIKRYKSNGNKLKLLVLMNKSNCDRFVENEISKVLSSNPESMLDCEEILNNVELIPTVPDRIVSKIDDEEILDQIRTKLNKYEHTLSSRELAKLNLEFKHNFFLFNAEKKYSLYVPNYLKEAKEFPGTQLVDNLNLFLTVKNKYINGPHAILAWLGGLLGYKTIAQAIENTALRNFINRLMQQEIAPILKAEFKELNDADLEQLRHSFIERCRINIKDLVQRVGRDPLRKLNANGCIRGVLELKQKNNLKLATPCLEEGIAAGILYAIKKLDAKNKDCQKILDIYKFHQSLSAVLCFRGRYSSGYFMGLHPLKDRRIIANVIGHIQKNMSYIR